MVNTIVPISGYVHLYRSLLRFYHLSENEIKEMLFVLNTANLDCFGYFHPCCLMIESGPVSFELSLNRLDYRPYRTEVQLYKSLLFLQYSLDKDLMTGNQREALQKLRCILSNIEYRFYKAFGIEIEDNRTVYSECVFHAIPNDNEPSVCLIRDWIYLPTA